MKKILISALALSSIFALTSCQNSTINDPISQNNTLNASSVEKTSEDGFQVVRTVNDVKFWDKIELIRANDATINPEKTMARGRQRDVDIVKAFGTDLPSSRDFCLHDAGAPATLKYPTPILLVHGANTTATRSWADPDGDGKKTGLMQYLKGQGYRVFAITFANKHGDNFIWSSHIHRAISRIKEITKVDKVDTLGHSKGGFALRMYVSNVNNGKTSEYGNDVRKAIFVGAPHRGIDYSFRHPSVQWAIYPESDNPLTYAPIVWTKILWEGQWKSSYSVSMSGDYFPGQSQIVGRFDKSYPLLQTEPDWYTTYNGGQGFVSYSPGIDAVMKQGGNLVDRVKKSPVVPDVKVALLAGNSPTVPGVLNELTGPSDGVLFVESAKATSDVIAGGAKLLGEKTMLLNHLDLVSNPSAMKWISEQLAK